MKNLIGIISFILLLVSCDSTQNVVANATDLKEIAQMVDSKNIKFIAETASPIATREMNQLSGLLPQGSTPSRIILSGGSDYFKMIGDSIAVEMAYYGTRQAGGPYESNRTGIELNAKPKEYDVKFDDKRKTYTLKYRVHDNRESYNFTLKVFGNKKAELYLNSSHRSSITYNGYVRKEE